jgi:hypothetical protein
VFSPLIGYYTGTNNPGTVTSNNGNLLFEFRSDCAITESGWEATFEGQFTPVGIDPSLTDDLTVYPNPTTGIINLPQIDNLKWQLFDATGRLIAEGADKKYIDLRELGLAEQTHSLKLLTNGSQTVIKLVFLKP